MKLITLVIILGLGFLLPSAFPIKATSETKTSAPALKPSSKSKSQKKKRASRSHSQKESTKKRVYIVKPGDSLQSISKKIYGVEDFAEDIYLSNPDLSDNSGVLIPGDKITLPKKR